MKKKIILILIIVILGLLFSFCNDDVDIEREARKLGLSIPRENVETFNIRFETLDGETVRLYDYKGKVILLNLWATWCVPCRIEMPSMEKLHQKYKDKDFKLIAVNMEENISIQKINKFINDNELTFEIGLDTYSEAEDKFFTGSIPISYLIDKDFNIAGRVIGTADWSSQPAYTLIDFLLKKETDDKEGN
jgi:thiol-disulfide isomerase/thioredoxin